MTVRVSLGIQTQLRRRGVNSSNKRKTYKYAHIEQLCVFLSLTLSLHLSLSPPPCLNTIDYCHFDLMFRMVLIHQIRSSLPIEYPLKKRYRVIGSE